MAIDAMDLIDAMMGAIKPILNKYWGDVKDYAETESEKMAATITNITELVAADKIDQDEAQALLDMQKHSMQAVLLTVEGIGLIAAQQAINAALAAIGGIVNKAIGFALL